MYIDTTTGDYPLTADDIKARFPNTSFPSLFVAPDGYAEVMQTPMPQWNPAIERVIEGAPELFEGAWRRTWIIEKIYPDTNAEAAALAAHEAKALQDWRDQTTCSTFQAKAALHNAGLLDAVTALINDTTTDPLVVLAWNNVTEFRRTSAMIVSLAAKLNLSDTQLDDLFTAAAKITA